MPLADAVDVIEMIGGSLLGMSAVAFVFLAVFAEIRRTSSDVAPVARPDGLAESREPSAPIRPIEGGARAEKRPAPQKAPARKAA